MRLGVGEMRVGCPGPAPGEVGKRAGENAGKGKEQCTGIPAKCPWRLWPKGGGNVRCVIDPGCAGGRTGRPRRPGPSGGGDRQARRQHGHAEAHMLHARRALWVWRASAVWFMRKDSRLFTIQGVAVA